MDLDGINSVLENKTETKSQHWCSALWCWVPSAHTLQLVPAVADERVLSSVRSGNGTAARAVFQQGEEYCVLRQPPSEFSEESRAGRKFSKLFPEAGVNCKYSAKTVLKLATNFIGFFHLTVNAVAEQNGS